MQSRCKTVAGATRLELATSGVTGRRSNQLNYAPAKEATTGGPRRTGRKCSDDGL